MKGIDIFDFLKFKNVRRTYGNPEQLEKDISSMPVTICTSDGKDLVVYLLVKHYSTKSNSEVQTISHSPYQNIAVIEDQIVCQRFDSTEPVRYDMLGNRLNEDSKLELRELD